MLLPLNFSPSLSLFLSFYLSLTLAHRHRSFNILSTFAYRPLFLIETKLAFLLRLYFFLFLFLCPFSKPICFHSFSSLVHNAIFPPAFIITFCLSFFLSYPLSLNDFLLHPLSSSLSRPLFESTHECLSQRVLVNPFISRRLASSAWTAPAPASAHPQTTFG